MTKTRVLSIVLVLSVVSGSALAETAIAPLPLSECQAVAATLTKTTGIKLNVAEGDVPEYLEGLRGKACRMVGKATGLSLDFEKVQGSIHAALTGWTYDSQKDADAPYSVIRTLDKGNQRLVYALATDPPKGTCTDNRPIVDCKVPHKRWNWDFSISAFAH
jgi:hypothetical protein